jgi:BirA family biotin operon repressor/biotin-[acetyl-CoA-carboxylase] ligase
MADRLVFPSDPVPVPLETAFDTVGRRVGAFGSPLVYLEQTGSTNDIAAQLATAGAPHGTLVVAGSQTQGRGRQGRRWFSPPGAGLYFSLLLRPGPDEVLAGATRLLTLTAGVAVAEGIETATGLRPAIKWPNDLVVGDETTRGGRWRKLAGILAEGSASEGVVQHVVLGVGINVRDTAYPPELCDVVTSIGREVRADVSGWQVLAECVAALATRWQQVVEGRGADVLQAWRARAASIVGAAVQVETSGGTATGITSGLDEDGALVVDVDGLPVRVVAGEVRWL